MGDCPGLNQSKEIIFITLDRASLSGLETWYMRFCSTEWARWVPPSYLDSFQIISVPFSRSHAEARLSPQDIKKLP
jgi:hypothetical protein